MSGAIVHISPVPGFFVFSGIEIIAVFFTMTLWAHNHRTTIAASNFWYCASRPRRFWVLSTRTRYIIPIYLPSTDKLQFTTSTSESIAVAYFIVSAVVDLFITITLCFFLWRSVNGDGHTLMPKPSHVVLEGNPGIWDSFFCKRLSESLFHGTRNVQ
ncbi:hypothetical protein IW261DRAFT_1417452 [Armillaria novae-zelandiae]|uniref:Uncharacterized protein n=1 Tax=Armillaria novae-zelandiae TaxID=153914 RepID=A0AA39ULF1_9AGAR|nr:hypothetical protein IW261DRAFT_1417452 [Armillaria novae-zelandiae]